MNRWATAYRVQHAAFFNELSADPSCDQDVLEREPTELYDWLIAPIADRLSDNTTLIIEARERSLKFPWKLYGTYMGASASDG
jgi:CHAT domain-containing protein